jgi:hypothetical protein
MLFGERHLSARQRASGERFLLCAKGAKRSWGFVGMFLIPEWLLFFNICCCNLWVKKWGGLE